MYYSHVLGEWVWPHAHIDVTAFQICLNCSVVSACIVELWLCMWLHYNFCKSSHTMLISGQFFLLSVGSLREKKTTQELEGTHKQGIIAP